MIEYITVKSSKRTELIDITKEVQKILNDSGVTDGVCYIYVPHATCGVTINEGPNDPSVGHDTSLILTRLIPKDFEEYIHDGNSDAHIKSSLIGASAFVLVENGRLMLGKYQAIFFCEFVGPRERKLAIKIMAG